VRTCNDVVHPHGALTRPGRRAVRRRVCTSVESVGDAYPRRGGGSGCNLRQGATPGGRRLAPEHGDGAGRGVARGAACDDGAEAGAHGAHAMERLRLAEPGAPHEHRRRYHVYVRTWRCWRCSCEAGGRGGGSRGSGGGLAATQAAGGASRALRRGARRHELLEHVHPRYESWIGDRGPDRRRALERRLRRGCIQRHKEQKQQGLLHAANRESAQCHLRTYVGAISELRQQWWR
jgi:hypothetical protein